MKRRVFIKKFINPSIIIFATALLVRIYYLVWYFIIAREVPFRLYLPTADRRFYDSLATSFLNGYGLNFYNIFLAYYPPFYPLFLSFLYSIFGHNQYSYLAVFLVQALVSSVSVVLVFWIGKNIFNPAVGFIAAIITVFYSPFITTIQDLELENLLIFMPLLAILLIININEKSTWFKKVTCGIAIGLTILTKFVFLFILPFFVFLWLWFISFRQNFWKNFFIITITTFFVFSLWLARNYLIFNKILISSQPAQALISITNPKYGTWNRLVTRQFIFEEQRLNEAEKNSFFTKKAINNFKRYPFLFIKRFIYNWCRLFFQNLNLDFPLPLAILSIIGLVSSLFRKNYKAWVILLFFLLFCAQYTLIEALTRYRMPLDWIIILFTSYGIYNVGNLIIKKLKSLFIFRKRTVLLLVKKYLSAFINKRSENYFSSFWVFLSLAIFILIFQFLAKVAWVYAFPEEIPQPIIYDYLIQETITKNNLLSGWNLQKEKNITYEEVYDYQKQHHGEITPFLDKIVVWKGEINYLNLNAQYPYGSAKHPKESQKEEYRGFYDIYTQSTNNYTALDLIINRGETPGYYGDGVAMVNYLGRLDPSFHNSNVITVVGKVIGQNYFGQIYLEGYGVFK